MAPAVEIAAWKMKGSQMGGIDHPDSKIQYGPLPFGWKCPSCGAVAAPHSDWCSWAPLTIHTETPLVWPCEPVEVPPQPQLFFRTDWPISF